LFRFGNDNVLSLGFRSAGVGFTDPDPDADTDADTDTDTDTDTFSASVFVLYADSRQDRLGYSAIECRGHQLR